MIDLRPGRPDDAPVLAAIADAAYRHYIARIGRPPGPMLLDYTAVLHDQTVWVADVDDRPVGFVAWTQQPDHLFIENVAVHPDHQGHGIGRTLLDHAEHHAAQQHLPQVRLYTHETMAENLALYRARGYLETRRATEDDYRRIHLTKPLHQDPGHDAASPLAPSSNRHASRTTESRVTGSPRDAGS